MFDELESINKRSAPFEFCTTRELWTDEHISKRMLTFHLDGNVDISSRNAFFIKRSVEWIVSRFGIGKNTNIADFGCGPGLYTKILAEKQARVTGIDFSKNSIQYARQIADRDGISIDYVNENYLEYETDKCFDLAMMIMCDFCALSPENRKKMLMKFHGMLNPGAHVLIDVYSLAAFQKRHEMTNCTLNSAGGFWSQDRYYEFLNIFKYETEKVVLDKYTIVEKSRTSTFYNWLQYFSPEVLESEFKECGFEIENFYSDVAGTPFVSEADEFAVVARKVDSLKVF